MKNKFTLCFNALLASGVATSLRLDSGVATSLRIASGVATSLRLASGVATSLRLASGESEVTRDQLFEGATKFINSSFYLHIPTHCVTSS